MSAFAVRLGRMLLCIAATSAIILGGGVFSDSAYADERAYSVYVGGQEMKASADGVVSYYVNGESGQPGTVSETEQDGWNARLSYNAENGLTLELNNLQATGDTNASKATQGNSDAEASLEKCSGIHSASSLALVLRGGSTAIGVEYDATYNWNDAGKVVSGNTGDSKSYGVFVAGDLTVLGDGSLKAVASDADGSCYGVYASGELSVVGNCTLEAEAGGFRALSKKRSGTENYGIFAEGSIAIGNDSSCLSVLATAGDSYSESCGIGSGGDVTVKNGSVSAVAGYASGGYSDGILALSGTFSLSGGEVVALAEGSSGMTTGLTANGLAVAGGSLSATAGASEVNGGNSAGIYVGGGMVVSGGAVSAKGGNWGTYNYGIEVYGGDALLTGGSSICATSGPGSYSVGFACEKDVYYSTATGEGGSIVIEDDATLYASGGNPGSDGALARCYSYGVFASEGLVVAEKARLEAVAGCLSSDKLSGKEKRSFGIYLGHTTGGTLFDDFVLSDRYDEETFYGVSHSVLITDGATVIAKSLDSNESTATQVRRAAAIACYNDSYPIAFSSEASPDATWYQWSEEEHGDFVDSSTEPYSGLAVSEGNRFCYQNTTKYLCVKPISEECAVTFDPNGGTLSGSESVQSVSVASGSAVEEPDEPEREGYTFVGWFKGEMSDDGNLVLEGDSYDFSVPVTSDFTLYAKWEPATDTKYTVNHWLQDVSGKGYSLAPDCPQVLSGTTGALTAAEAREYDGFVAQPFEQEAIAADGSTVVDIYYEKAAPAPDPSPEPNPGPGVPPASDGSGDSGAGSDSDLPLAPDGESGSDSRSETPSSLTPTGDNDLTLALCSTLLSSIAILVAASYRCRKNIKR